MSDPRLAPVPQAMLLLAQRQDLGEELATAVFGAVMRGETSPAQLGALLLGLRVKGETPEEVAGAARALRDVMLRVEAEDAHLVDTCGTGGGRVTTFNISTAAAFVAAGAGAAVAKHGNRSFTSQCGSADVLTFLFAPTFHPAMRHVGSVRRELGVPSVMNLLGPLANPAGVKRQVVGVADGDRAPLMAEALIRLGAEHALVVHARVGMDEIAPVGITDVWEVQDGTLTTWELDPAVYGLAVRDGSALEGGAPAENAARVERILGNDGADESGRAAVLLNAGAAIYVAGLSPTYCDGVQRAQAAVTAGRAGEVLERLRRASPSTSG